jgi:hypothetical protein
MITTEQQLITNPFNFLALGWPDISLYPEQAAIVQSVVDNDETIVPAGNALGKDFIAAFICLWFFCSRSPCKVITHSVDQPQLKGVLWGEMKRFIETSKVKLPLKVREDMFMQFIRPDGTADPLSYLIGRVTRKGEGLLGHHVPRTEMDRMPDGTLLPRTFFLADESSGIDDEAWEKVDTWCHRKLSIGNPYPCTNFFYKGVKGGNIERTSGKGRFRNIIHISAKMSPNVQLGLRQKEQGIEPTHEVLIPGLKTYGDYVKHRTTWDEIRQCIGLDGKFYEGREVKLYPPDWLDRAEEIAEQLPSYRSGKAMGIDAAEGGDNSVWAIVDDQGLIHIEAIKTADTNDIPGITIRLGQQFNVPPERWVFDRGGGGKQHADRLRADGYQCSSIGFGEGVIDPQAWKRTANYIPKKEVRGAAEERYIYKNRRAELYGTLRQALDPVVLEKGFGLPKSILRLKRQDGGPCLRDQLEILPLWYDKEGRLYLPPKRKDGHKGKEDKDTMPSISEMLDGYSPDEADALVLACYGMTYKNPPVIRSMIA